MSADALPAFRVAVDGDVAAEGEASRNGTEPERAPTLFLPADELLAQTPAQPEWVWEDTLARGAVSLFAKKPKLGGSTLTYGLVEATANREPEYLGRALHGGPVIYASEEGHATLGATFPRNPDIHLATRESAWPKPAWADLIADAARKAREVNAPLCVIDTFTFWNGLGPDAEKDAGSVQALMDTLTAITSTGCAVWLTHHHRKAGGEDGDALRGTTAIAGGVDCFAELEKIEDAPATHRRLVITPRWAAPPVLVLDYSPSTGYHAIGHAADRETSSEIGWTDRVLDAIPTEGEGVTLDDIAQTLGADRRKWHKTVATLLREQRITRTGKGNRWDPYRHHQVTVPASRPDAGTDKDGSVTCIQPSTRIGTDEYNETATHHQPSPRTARTDNQPDPTDYLPATLRTGTP